MPTFEYQNIIKSNNDQKQENFDLDNNSQNLIIEYSPPRNKPNGSSTNTTLNAHDKRGNITSFYDADKSTMNKSSSINTFTNSIYKTEFQYYLSRITTHLESLKKQIIYIFKSVLTKPAKKKKISIIKKRTDNSNIQKNGIETEKLHKVRTSKSNNRYSKSSRPEDRVRPANKSNRSANRKFKNNTSHKVNNGKPSSSSLKKHKIIKQTKPINK